MLRFRLRFLGVDDSIIEHVFEANYYNTELSNARFAGYLTFRKGSQDVLKKPLVIMVPNDRVVSLELLSE